MRLRQEEYAFSHTFEQPIQLDPRLIQAKPEVFEQCENLIQG